MPVETNVEEQSNHVTRLLTETGKALKAAEAQLANTDRESAQQLAAEQAAHEREFFQKKVDKMIDQGVALHETAQYDEAIALANKILEIDPTNSEAHAIVSALRRARALRSENSSTRNTANNFHSIVNGRSDSTYRIATI